jgi:hypothetical protein
METMTLTDQQRLCIADLPADYRMIGVDRSAPFVLKPTGQIMRIQQNGRLTSATTAARRRLADPDAEERGRLAGGMTQPDQPSQSDDLTLRLRRLEGSAQAALATLRRSLVQKVPPTRDGLAHEAAIAFDVGDDQEALAMIDEVAQTVGICGLG